MSWGEGGEEEKGKKKKRWRVVPLRSRGRGSLSRRRSCGLLGRRGLGLDRPEQREGGDVSAFILCRARQVTSGGSSSYNHAPINAHDKVEPRLDGELRVGVAQHLEPKQPLLLLGSGILAVEAGYEAVKGVEHGQRRFLVYRSIEKGGGGEVEPS